MRRVRARAGEARVSRLTVSTCGPGCGAASPSALALTRVPDGFEGAPLGFWCPVCGAAVPPEEQSLALVETRRSDRPVCWLMPVHAGCCLWPAQA